MKIAIIGTGISGLGAAYLLNPLHNITVYEKNDYIGGHSRTITLPDGRAVDTGFIVYNERNYPLLLGLFRHLNVPVIKSEMSFGASIGNGWLEYGSKGMFGQVANILRPRYWRMLADILRFNRQAPAFIDRPGNITLGTCLDQLKMGDWSRRYYIQAMGAAIWSCSIETILDFPAQTFLRFFQNHGLLTVNDHPQWYTVKGGSREYVSRLTASFRDKIVTGCGVKTVSRSGGKVQIHDERGAVREFDHVVFACHADQTLQLLNDADEKERDIFESFGFQENRLIVHRDTSFMPKHRKCWASWVYLSGETEDKKPVVSLSYWMNNLQSLPGDPVIITLNPGRRPAENTIVDEHVFDHPVFTQAAINAQERIPELQGYKNTWHCGAWQRYGFHEDGLLSAVNMAKGLGANVPWK
ncbi:MAG TPA: FAD-dependent oxidoreductase [Patescibacteria group bacterium]|nr:FAD-dependent oxidoreductase [Patescibacteria group bacterium]